MRNTLSTLFCLILSLCHAQWKETFDSALDNAWQGDRSHFVINTTNQLQLMATNGGSSSLFHPIDSHEIMHWTFYFKMQFAPSSSNRLIIYLMTDRVSQDSSRAYILEVGENGNNDNWKFYRKNAGLSSLLAEGTMAKLAADPAQARMDIRKNEFNQWNFSADYNGNQQFAHELTVIDSLPLELASYWFGWQCIYTDTRKDKFIFDDICIGPPVTDLDPPRIIEGKGLKENVIQVQFNEDVDSNSALDLKNYLLDAMHSPVKITKTSGTNYELEFSIKLVHGQRYELQYQDIRDLNGNTSPRLLFSFIFKQISQAEPLDILITEIMADPTPVIGLPEREFIELKNMRSHALDLADYMLTDGSTFSKLPKFILDTQSYLILCHVRDTQLFKSFGQVLGLANFPSLNNSGDLVSLRNKHQALIHEVVYDDSWYGSSIKKEGGYSLEMKNTGFPCAGKENWTGSNHPLGGTPGTKNSVEVFLKDMQGPRITEAIAVNEYEIVLKFDERLSSAFSLPVSSFKLNPSRHILSAEILSPSYTEVLLVFNEPLTSGVEYTLEVKEIRDCMENYTVVQYVKLALGAEADYRDLVFSEVLFDPYTGGADFVEMYNRSSKIISLRHVLLKNKNWKDTWISIASDKIMYPDTYFALTPDPDFQFRTYFKMDSARILNANIPSIDDHGGNLQLGYQRNNMIQILDSFTFSKSWHHPFIKDPEGVSLEKVDFEKASDNPHNWQSAAASYGYATPGLKNSHSQQTIGKEIKDKPYDLSSQVVSPNGDSYRDFLQIQFKLDKAGYKLRMEVFDLTGIKMKPLTYKVIAADDIIVWNGDDTYGNLLPVGNYIIYIELIHPDGKIVSFKERITIDY
jgi:hypothetical protein